MSGDRHRAGGAVEGGAGVVTEHRPAESAARAGADDDQVGLLLLGLLMQALARAARDDAHQLCLHARALALSLQQSMRAFLLGRDRARAGRVDWAQHTAVDVEQRQLSCLVH